MNLSGLTLNEEDALRPRSSDVEYTFGPTI